MWCAATTATKTTATANTSPRNHERKKRRRKRRSSELDRSVEEKGLFIEQPPSRHREAKTTATINSKTNRRSLLGLQDEDALSRDALYARRVNSRAFPNARMGNPTGASRTPQRPSL